MKKLLIALLVLLMLAGCSGNGPAPEPENKSVTETDYVRIEGVYVDKSYDDGENGKQKMVYVFYTAFTNAENLEISSKLSKMTIEDTNTYSSEKNPNVPDMFGSYYYSSYIEDVYVGDELKVLSTFKVPEGELSEGRSVSIQPYGIPDGDKIKMSTDDFIFVDSVEEIAKQADPEGYNNYVKMHEPADDDTTKRVRDSINGYEWDFFVNSTSYELEFYGPNNFELRVRSLGQTTGGTYEVKNGYITLHYESNGHVLDIPYTWEDGEVDPDVIAAFDVK